MKKVSQLVDEMERVALTGQALRDLLYRELLVSTGVDLNFQHCELDVERGILTCEDAPAEITEVTLEDAPE